MLSSAEKVWLPYYKPVEDAKIRLVCFHWAGGSASAYNGPAWKDLPAKGVDFLAVQLPGREQRNKEPTPKTAQDAAKLAVKGLSRFFAPGSIPTILFAHSMVSLISLNRKQCLFFFFFEGEADLFFIFLKGTWVAFEFARELRKQNLQLPQLLIVSNLAAPQVRTSVTHTKKRAWTLPILFRFLTSDWYACSGFSSRRRPVLQ